MTTTSAHPDAGEPHPTRRSGTEQRRRTEVVAFRLLPEEHTRLEQAATERATTPSDLAREAALREISPDDASTRLSDRDGSTAYAGMLGEIAEAADDTEAGPQFLPDVLALLGYGRLWHDIRRAWPAQVGALHRAHVQGLGCPFPDPGRDDDRTAEHDGAEHGAEAGRPRVVTLCGSMRFYAEMLAVAGELTGAGDIVLAPFEVVAPADQEKARVGEKERLDELHRRKIDRSDAVVVVSDSSGYYGASTRGEIAYAVARGLPVTERCLAAGEAGRQGALPHANPQQTRRNR